MLVIADASPLRYLILIGQIEILPVLYDRVMAPEVVIMELGRSQTPASVRRWLQAPPVWLDIRQPMLAPSDTMAELGAGERDAILLARELSADLVLMDDRSGRAEAHRQQVVTTGTLGVLESAAIRGLLQLPEALSRLLETNFYVAPSLIDDLLERDATRRSGPETAMGENGDPEAD